MIKQELIILDYVSTNLKQYTLSISQIFYVIKKEKNKKGSIIKE